MATFELLLDNIPRDVASLPLKSWNKGIFDHELLRKNLVDRGRSGDKSVQLKEGTYAGTQLALTELFDRIERSFGTFFDVLGVESTIPRPMTLNEKKAIYKYQASTKDRYPPHLDSIPTKDQVSQFEIFDKLGLLQAATLLPNVVPKDFISRVAAEIGEKFREWIFGDPEEGFTIAEVEQSNRENRKSGTDVMRGANIGDVDDWYTDARFAQQQFTGVDPTTICKSPLKWIIDFRSAAVSQQRNDMATIIKPENKDWLYIQDYSYFRIAMDITKVDQPIWNGLKNEEAKFGCASVCLFHLNNDGLLHPLAIIIDWKGSMAASVCIFNKRISASDTTRGEYWPWRYAKSCLQSSSWTRHELTSHLTHTHFIEEAIIVATHRTIPVNHIIFQLLEPHWFRTLSLNAAARETLVPSIVFALVGYTQDHGYAFMQHDYHDFNFVNKYVPTDLRDRGFPIAELDSPKFKNYAYGRNMILMWKAIREFVSSMISMRYASDQKVTEDHAIKDWCDEIRSAKGAQISSFPMITTRAELIDALTMCIHIASPQHTAVNYLQAYYQTFVINKPPCLYKPLPTTLKELQNYNETDLVKSLPIGRQREWLLASHIPWLLSFRPAADNNLINYAASLWNLYRKKPPQENGPAVTEIARKFYEDLRGLIVTFQRHSAEMTPGTIPYTVMDPNETAVSILS